MAEQEDIVADLKARAAKLQGAQTGMSQAAQSQSLANAQSAMKSNAQAKSLANANAGMQSSAQAKTIANAKNAMGYNPKRNRPKGVLKVKPTKNNLQRAAQARLQTARQVNNKSMLARQIKKG